MPDADAMEAEIAQFMAPEERGACLAWMRGSSPTQRAALFALRPHVAADVFREMLRARDVYYAECALIMAALEQFAARYVGETVDPEQAEHDESTLLEHQKSDGPSSGARPECRSPRPSSFRRRSPRAVLRPDPRHDRTR